MFEAKIAGFLSGLKNMQKGLARWRKRLADVGNIITGINQAFGLLGRAGRFVQRQFADVFGFVDEMAKVSDRLGILPAQLMEFRLAGELAGVRFRELELAMQRMARRVSQAAHNTGEAQQAIKDLGFDARQLSKLGIDLMFRRILGALEGVADAGKRIEFAQKIFDSEGVKNIQITGKVLAQARKDVYGLGLAFSRVDLRIVERAKDAFTRLQFAIRGLKVQLAIFFAPIIEHVLGLLIEWRKSLGDPREWLADVGAKVAWFFGVIVDGLRDIKRVIGEILKGLDTMFGTFFGNIGVGENTKTFGAWIEEFISGIPGGSAAEDFPARFRSFMAKARADAKASLGDIGAAFSAALGASMGTAQRILGQQISPTRTALGGAGPSRIQQVRDPQLGRVITVLSTIEKNTRGTGTAVTAP